MTSLSSRSYAPYNDDSRSFEGYQRGYGHRTYPPSYGVPSMFCGYPVSQSSTSSWDYQSPHYASSLMSSNSNYQDFQDSIDTSRRDHFAPSIMSSNSNYQDFQDSIDTPRRDHFAPSITMSSSSYDHSQYSPPHSPAQRISTPGQLQMVTRGNSRNRSLSPEHTPTTMSPHWSTEGTARSGSPSVTSSQGRYYGHDLRDMRYSGYVESFDDREFYGSSDEEYASDDAGYYYSSESEPEFDRFSEGSDDDEFYSSE